MERGMVVGAALIAISALLAVTLNTQASRQAHPEFVEDMPGTQVGQPIESGSIRSDCGAHVIDATESKPRPAVSAASANIPC